MTSHAVGVYSYPSKTLKLLQLLFDQLTNVDPHQSLDAWPPGKVRCYKHPDTDFVAYGPETRNTYISAFGILNLDVVTRC